MTVPWAWLRDVGRKHRLGLAAAGILAVRLDQRLDVVAAHQREQLEVIADVAIIGVVPELIKLVRRRELGIEVDRRAGVRLAELGARRRGDERVDEPVRLAVLDPPDQVHAGRDVPPLIAAPHLQRAAMAAEQLQEIERLQQHVTELGV